MIQGEAGNYWFWISRAVGSIIGIIGMLHFVLVFVWFSTTRQAFRINLEASTAFEKWESVLDKAGMDFKTCASIHDDLLMRKELERAGVCIPGDSLNIILELRKAQTQTTAIRADNHYSGGVSEMSVQLPTVAETVVVSPTIVQTSPHRMSRIVWGTELPRLKKKMIKKEIITSRTRD